MKTSFRFQVSVKTSEMAVINKAARMWDPNGPEKRRTAELESEICSRKSTAIQRETMSNRILAKNTFFCGTRAFTEIAMGALHAQMCAHDLVCQFADRSRNDSSPIGEYAEL